MNDLVLFDNGLVPVYDDENGNKVVDGRELWERLQSKQQFADWIDLRFKECDAVENTEYKVFQNFTKNPKGGRPTTEYIISLPTAKEMAMLERNAIGKQVRKYFIDVENKFDKAKTLLTNLSPQLQLLITMETRQTEMQKQIDYTDKKVDGIPVGVPFLYSEKPTHNKLVFFVSSIYSMMSFG